MQKKICLRNSFEKKVACVVCAEAPLQKELEKVFIEHPGQGFSLEVTETAVRIVDYFAGETRAEFQILSIEDTDEPLRYHMLPCDK